MYQLPQCAGLPKLGTFLHIFLTDPLSADAYGTTQSGTANPIVVCVELPLDA